MSLHDCRIVLRCSLALVALAGASFVDAQSATQTQSPAQSTPTTEGVIKQPRPALKVQVPPGLAARFAQKVLKLPIGDCMATAEYVVENQLKLRGVRRSDEWIGGHNGQAHGYIYCVRLPGAGACNGDASTAIVITSGGSGEAMESLFQALYDAIPVKVPIDCPQ